MAGLLVERVCSTEHILRNEKRPPLEEQEDVIPGQSQLGEILTAGRLRPEVPRDAQRVPRVHGAVGQDDPRGHEREAAVELVGLRHGRQQLIATDVKEVRALLHVVPGTRRRRGRMRGRRMIRKKKNKKNEKNKIKKNKKKSRPTPLPTLVLTHSRGKPVNGWLGESVLW
ncbi:hypothetical protein EYF80_050796 [Liparis tanakae]|uniref:Uncharacterized protein n=1 Tax=Liparis tanakae TaxID=230148 RepID=A0A4Z2FCY3_9TELE|nr:hypothetical protein EYF80_050796 [Liparis tanakae]